MYFIAGFLITLLLELWAEIRHQRAMRALLERQIALLKHNRSLWALRHAVREAPNKVELLSTRPYREWRQ